MQEDRERMVVRRFKFEEIRIEQIQDLEVIFAESSWTNYVQSSILRFPRCTFAG